MLMHDLIAWRFPRVRLEALNIAAGMLAALLLGYWYSSGHIPDERWFQRFMAPAVNYACTGHFGAVHLAPNATEADRAAVRLMEDFLHVRRTNYSCDSFPRALPTSFFDGLDSNNIEQPIYLMFLYGVLWR